MNEPERIAWAAMALCMERFAAGVRLCGEAIATATLEAEALILNALFGAPDVPPPSKRARMETVDIMRVCAGNRRRQARAHRGRRHRHD